MRKITSAQKNKIMIFGFLLVSILVFLARKSFYTGNLFRDILTALFFGMLIMLYMAFALFEAE